MKGGAFMISVFLGLDEDALIDPSRLKWLP
jgi:hypothetical protein